MKLKHDVIDSDVHFVVDPVTRNIDAKAAGKIYLMQHDHNSEVYTFEVPRYIENHDMAECDLIQVHYENQGTGTSISTRKVSRGVKDIPKERINTDNEDVIAFSWFVPNTATKYAGSLKFQLKFICYKDDETGDEGYVWHSNVNDDISITAGLGYTEEDMTPSTSATLRSLELVELHNGVDVILDNKHYPIYHGKDGVSGVYVGSGEMPEGYNIQIDPDGTPDDDVPVGDIESIVSAVLQALPTYNGEVE